MFRPRAADGPGEPARPEYSNWGRWGTGDEAGAANLITPEKVLRALRLPERGRAVPLAQVIGDRDAPSTRHGYEHFMLRDAGDYAAGASAPGGFKAATDYVSLRVHGATTHLDALGHAWYGERLYNGFEERTVRSSGMRRLGIDKAPPMVTRGVLLDLAAAAGMPHLPAGHEIGAAELEAAFGRAGVTPEPGDAVLLRTGWIRMWRADREAYLGDRPGIGLEAAEWLARRDVALVGADTSGVEVIPWAPGTVCPVHQFLIRDCGVYLLEFLDLEELAETGATAFLFLVAPLRIRGGTGSPVAPVAVL
ncbi:kynurenine formamidase [Thermocatellispora tengchongensis]|uniref:Kynurenine formamidase n=1 Tax=Thermocatellispora tengchongensis TaxID=1073253 RepID=A0A840PH32_9ACTN|nr:cyclase family protein [Thermocatellispora tengchongensis]MBB5136830.1 kynurenine formamidase [Thermocatellispora tengchongensis]